MRPERTAGWDVGGAHLKVAAVEGAHVRDLALLPCPLWLGLHHLEAAVDEARARIGANIERHAVTMTGEIADLFRDRGEGVRALIDVVAGRLGAKELLIYAGTDGFLAPAAAAARPEGVAAANWMASASLVAAKIESALFIDIGSTTSDIVAVVGGRPDFRGRDDHERLRREELVYTGCVRTPVAAVVSRVPFGGEWVDVMAEQFATMADVHRLTDALPAHADLHPSADAGPKTVDASARRLARMIGLDAQAAPTPVWRQLARHISERQLQRLQAACERVLSRGAPEPAPTIVGAGVGRFLAEQLAARLGRAYLDFDALLEFAAETGVLRPADCAPAVAVAVLAQAAFSRTGQDRVGRQARR